MVAPSKIRNNAIELNKIQYIDGNNRINFTTDVYSNGSPIADATAGSYANSGLLQANSAFGVANSAALYANGSFAQANAAYASANNVAPQIQPAFDTANSAALYANGAFIQSNTKLSSSGGTVNGDLAITGNLIVSGSRIEINTATVLLNDNILTINSDLPNNILPTENAGIEINRGSSPNVALLWNESTDSWTFTNDGTNYEQLGGGSAGSYANSAFIKANAAFNKANSAVSRESFLANTGQTLFTTNGYNIGYVDVFVNGIKLYSAEDFTATDGANVSISQPTITQNDVVEIINWGGTAEPISRVDQYARDLSNVSSSISNTAIVNANLSYLHANAAYNVANTLIASSIDLYARPHANAAFNHANSALLHANSAYNKANSTIQAFANFYYSVNDASGDLTIANTGTYGATMGFNVRAIEKNIVGNVSNYTWTHGYTGYYMITTTYRQASGGDVWTCLAICKNGPISAVGISARTGSEDSHNENYSIIYPVDDISATYQLQHWVGATGKSVTADMSQGNPGWTNYGTLHNNRAGDTGRMVDYIIRRLGDL